MLKEYPGTLVNKTHYALNKWISVEKNEKSD